MIARCCQVILIIAAMSLFGCNVSLQSSQFGAVKNLLNGGSQVAKMNWQVTWDGRDHLVYAVNHDRGIYFANEAGLLVKFEGAHVSSLALPGPRTKNIVEIKKVVLDDGDISLHFDLLSGRRSISLRHICSPWRPVSLRTGGEKLEQRCSDGSASYTNVLLKNERRQLVGLKQVLVPGAAPISIFQR